jgi:hypothetical protein
MDVVRAECAKQTHQPLALPLAEMPHDAAVPRHLVTPSQL